MVLHHLLEIRDPSLLSAPLLVRNRQSGAGKDLMPAMAVVRRAFTYTPCHPPAVGRVRPLTDLVDSRESSAKHIHYSHSGSVRV